MYPYKVGQKVLFTSVSGEEAIYTISYINGLGEMFYLGGKHWCLPKDCIKPYFEIGDRVKILSKTVASGTETTEYKIGEIKEIELMSRNCIYFEKDGAFRPTDLEWMPEEKESKAMYKLLKSFNSEDIKDAQGNINNVEFMKHYIDFLEHYGPFGGVCDFNFDAFIANAKPEWIEFILKHKFIEKIEKTYKIDTELTEDEFGYLISCLNVSIAQFMENQKCNTYPSKTLKEDAVSVLGQKVFNKFDDIYPFKS